MPEYKVHLVGSIPFGSAAEVFERVGRQLGQPGTYSGRRNGARSQWLGWIDQIFEAHPDFVATDQEYRAHEADTAPTRRYRVRDGKDPATVSFDALPHAETAIASFADFARLKKAGIVPAGARFQFTLATPISVTGRYVVEEQQDIIEAAYTKALFDEVAKVAAQIPHGELSVQWDVASAIFRTLQVGTPKRYGATRDELFRNFSRAITRMGEAVPADIDLVYHFCYGSAGNRHTVEPKDMADMVEMANLLSAGITRPINLIHMPVPKERDDDAYFAPLALLKLRPETKLSLGLVHVSDGVEGTRRRLATAGRHLAEFSIAAECGFGRYPREKVPEVLAIHAEVAGIGS